MCVCIWAVLVYVCIRVCVCEAVCEYMLNSSLFYFCNVPCLRLHKKKGFFGFPKDHCPSLSGYGVAEEMLMQSSSLSSFHENRGKQGSAFPNCCLHFPPSVLHFTAIFLFNRPWGGTVRLREIKYPVYCHISLTCQTNPKA